MITRILIVLLSLAVLCPAQLKFQDDDESERTKYGMSQAEWQQFKESGLSVTQLEKLLECGIAMGEYSSRPWLSLGVQEKDWIAERCKGMVDEDIQAFHEHGENDYTIILAFALPGSYHWIKKSYATAAGLSTVFALSIGLYFALPEITEEPAPQAQGDLNSGRVEEVQTRRPVFLVIGLADMILSSVLAYRDFNKAKSAIDVKPESKTSLNLDFRGNGPELKYVYKF